jgi:uncharacterized protein
MRGFDCGMLSQIQLTPCRPPWWAQGGHAQTVLGHILSKDSNPFDGLREEVTLVDGEKIVLRWKAGTSGLVVYFFHGLSGDASSDYMIRAAQIAATQGHSVCLINHRGCGEGDGLALQPYHSGRGEDISSVLEWGRSKFLNKKHLAVGFSLSGNALLCLLSGIRGSVLPDYAVSINAPIDLRACAQQLERGFNRIYDFRFVRRLQKRLEDRYRKGWTSKPVRFPRFCTLRGFDSVYTGPVGGFGSGENYYDVCSTYGHLEKIKIPTLLITSEDDPFVPVETYRRARLSPSMHLHVEKHGGHMGYISKGADRRWLDHALTETIKYFALGK